MHVKSRAQRLFAFLVPAMALLFAPALDAAGAATKKRAAAPVLAPNTPDVPWLYRGSDIPQDKEWIFGELPNGVRYAVRKNEVPGNQVSIRIRMDVGSMYETPSEKGFSHLLEHLVFRQSKYIPEGQAFATWQRMGLAIGVDANAITGTLSTTYKFDLPGVTAASSDTAFKLLSGMIINPTLSEANVRTDVPIVLAEKRDGTTEERVIDQFQQTMFDGQKLGAWATIGTDETLNSANEGSVRAFHKRWYRPENAVIVAVGDLDPAVLVSQIKTWFGGWQGEGPRTPEPSFGDPVAPKGATGNAPIGATRVIVEPNLPRAITYAIMRPWRPVHDTVIYNQGNLVDAMAQAIINRRLEARARAGGSFLSASVGKEKFQRSADMTTVSVAPLGSDWKAALKDTRAVIADAMIRPPSQAEIDREVAEFRVSYESEVEKRALATGASLADTMVAALDIRETVASPEAVMRIFEGSRSMFTPANVLAHTRAMFRGTVTRAVYITPDAKEASAADLKLALSTAATANGSSRVDAKKIDFASLPAIGAPQQPVAIKPTGVLDIEQLEFANGVKVLLWPTTNESGRVTLKVRFGAGYRAFNAQTAPYASLGDRALIDSGVGSLGREELDKIGTGRKFGWDFAIEDSDFTFQSETRAADLQDQLYLFADKFASPRWDSNPVKRAQAAAKIGYESYASSPQGIITRDLLYYARNKNPVLRTPTPQEIDATTPEGFRQVWEPILKQGPIEIQLFGDFKRDDAIAELAKTFGALPPRGELPAGTAPATARSLAPSTQPVVLYHNGDKSQATAVLGWPTGGGMAGVHESRKLEILTQLFSNRVLDRLREKLGASYSPQAFNSWPLDLDGGGNIMVVAQISPEAVPVFYQTVDEIAADLAAHPVSADELSRVTEPLKQQISRSIYSSNAFIMMLLEGATSDPSRFQAVRGVLDDYTETSPDAMQALAKKYLTPGSSWRLAVLPQGQALSTAMPSAAPAGR